MTTRFVYDGQGIARDPSDDEVRAALSDADAGGFAWIDIDRQDRHGLEEAARRWGLHPLGVESALLSNERPQLTIFDDFLFLEFYGLANGGGEIEMHEISIFVGPQVVVTVRANEQPSIHHLAERTSQAIHKGHKPSPIKFLYGMLDELIDEYFTVVEAFGEQIEDIETRIVEETSDRPSLLIHEMRKRLLRLDRLLRPEREVFQTFARRDVTPVDDSMLVYFDDLNDHMASILDLLDSYREEMATLYEVQFAITSNRLNQTMRTLTVWSIILMATTLVAGIYGMNFKHMPELRWLVGYPFALGIMAVIAITMYSWFHWRKWIG